MISLVDSRCSQEIVPRTFKGRGQFFDRIDRRTDFVRLDHLQGSDAYSSPHRTSNLSPLFRHAKAINSLAKISGVHVLSISPLSSVNVQTSVCFRLPTQDDGTMSLRMKISISRAGVELGEWAAEEIEKFYKEGRLIEGDFFWKEGMSSWEPLKDLISQPPPPFPINPPVPQPRDFTIPVPEKHVPTWRDNRHLQGFAQAGYLMLVMGTIAGAKSVADTYPGTANTIFIGAIAGGTCGLLPFFAAKKRNLPRARYLIACAAVGSFGGFFLAIPLAIALFFYVRSKRPNPMPPSSILGK